MAKIFRIGVHRKSDSFTLISWLLSIAQSRGALSTDKANTRADIMCRNVMVWHDCGHVSLYFYSYCRNAHRPPRGTPDDRFPFPNRGLQPCPDHGDMTEEPDKYSHVCCTVRCCRNTEDSYVERLAAAARKVARLEHEEMNTDEDEDTEIEAEKREANECLDDMDDEMAKHAGCRAARDSGDIGLSRHTGSQRRIRDR